MRKKTKNPNRRGRSSRKQHPTPRHVKQCFSLSQHPHLVDDGDGWSLPVYTISVQLIVTAVADLYFVTRPCTFAANLWWWSFTRIFFFFFLTNSMLFEFFQWFLPSFIAVLVCHPAVFSNGDGGHYFFSGLFWLFIFIFLFFSTLGRNFLVVRCMWSLITESDSKAHVWSRQPTKQWSSACSSKHSVMRAFVCWALGPRNLILLQGGGLIYPSVSVCLFVVVVVVVVVLFCFLDVGLGSFSLSFTKKIFLILCCNVFRTIRYALAVSYSLVFWSFFFFFSLCSKVFF